MELVKVNDKEMESILRSTRSRPGKLQALIENFVCSGENIAKITFEKSEYKSVWSASASLGKACETSKYRVGVKVYKSELYLFKLDD